MIALAQAKVNLCLAVIGRRSNGYHELRSVFLRVGLSDRLEATEADDSAADRLTVTGGDDCPVDGNIVLRALAMLRASVERGSELPSLAFVLQKRIPVAAGLGGGSSDGAAALRLAAGLWQLDLLPHERNALAAQLGADVPFFAAELSAALVTGIGERQDALPPVQGAPGLLLVTPRERLATAAVFAALDRLEGRAQRSHVVDELAEAFRHGLDASTLAAWAPRLRDANHLWPAAVGLQPSLEGLRAGLERALDRPCLLSGSGSTLFALYPSLDEAREAGLMLASGAPLEITGATVYAVAGGSDIDQQAVRIQ